MHHTNNIRIVLYDCYLIYSDGAPPASVDSTPVKVSEAPPKQTQPEPTSMSHDASPAPTPAPRPIETQHETPPAITEPSRKRKPDEAAGPAPKQGKFWYNEVQETHESGGNTYYVIRAEKVPGQKKITNKMSNDEKLAVAEENEIIRQAALSKAIHETGKRFMLTGKFLNLGIPAGGHYDHNNEEHRKAVLDTATPRPVSRPAPKPKAEYRPIYVWVTIGRQKETLILYERAAQLTEYKIEQSSHTMMVQRQPTSDVHVDCRDWAYLLGELYDKLQGMADIDINRVFEKIDHNIKAGTNALLENLLGRNY